MATKAELIADLKKTYPVLKQGSEDVGYTDMPAQEYELTINSWADAQILAALPVAEPTILEKLDSIGVTIPELKAALGL